MVMCAIAMIAFGLLQSGLSLMLIFGFVIGFFIFGSMIGLYAITPNIYATEIRNTGMGWAIGIGRIGAVVGPLIAGFLLDRGWSGADCFVVFAVPLIIAMFAVLSMKQSE
jgi:MFS family permease